MFFITCTQALSSTVSSQVIQNPLLYFRFFDFLSEQSVHASDHPLTSERRDVIAKAATASSFGSSGEEVIRSRVLPVLALNEVFFGESLSSRVSYLEVLTRMFCAPDY